MKLSGLIDALIASGGSVEQVRAVVAAAEAAQEAEVAERRAKAAAKKKRQRSRKSPNVPGTDGDIEGQQGTEGDEQGQGFTPSSFPPRPPNNYPASPSTHTYTAPGARADAVAGFEPSSADVAALAAEGLGPVDIAAELPPFRDHWLASNDPLPADLGAAFRGFCRHGRGRRKPPRSGQGARASPAPPSDDGPRVNTPSGPRSVAFLLAQHRANRWSTLFGKPPGHPDCPIADHLPKPASAPALEPAE